MESIQNIIESISKYIGKNFFIKFSNTEDFPELSDETTKILKVYGLINHERIYPFLTTDGVLKRVNDHLVQVGVDLVGKPFCIDTTSDQLVLFNTKTNITKVTNSSIKKHLETKYTCLKYDDEIEDPQIYGKYEDNHLTYANKLKEMLVAIEPDVMSYEIWYAHVHEKELGVL